MTDSALVTGGLGHPGRWICDRLAAEAFAFENAKARGVLGWEPEHDWRTAAEGTVEAPSLVAE